MLIVKSEHVDEALLIDRFSAAGRSTENELVFLTRVAAEMNDMRLVQQQEPLQIDGARRRMFMQLELLPIRAFLNSFKDFSGFFIHEDAAGGPWICGQKQYADFFSHLSPPSFSPTFSQTQGAETKKNPSRERKLFCALRELN